MKAPRGLCAKDGCSNIQIKSGKSYGMFCDRHSRTKNPAPSDRVNARKGKGSFCAICGPDVAYHSCQLDLDHVDGDRTNDAPSNMQTLCANHHRLKSWQERQGINTRFQYTKARRMERHGGPNG